MKTIWEPKLLEINLTEEKILPKKPIKKDIIDNFLGGRGIAVYLAFNKIPTDTSPRGPDNAIVLGTGMLSGTRFPSSGMISATFKSPLTNTLFTSVSTGKLGAVLRTLGLDFILISGITKSPKFILIDEFSDIIFENAEKIWKMTALEADLWLRQKYGDNIHIMVIGQAAVNQVAYAGVAVDRINFFRRGGLGTVFASKNIKAIVINNTPKVQELGTFFDEIIENFDPLLTNNFWSKMIKKSGTFFLIDSALKREILPTKNCSNIFQIPLKEFTSFKGYKEGYDCWQCSIKCHRNSFQDILSLGPNLEIIDTDLIQKAIENCDREALDPLSTGAAMASLLNIQEDRRKLLNIKLGYKWGDPQIYSLINKIVLKDNIGDQLSRGESYLYKLTSEANPMIKNQIGGMYYYPNVLGVSLTIGISPYSSDNFHSDSMIFPELLGYPFGLNPRSRRGKARTVVLLENLIAVFESIIICNRYLPIILKSRNPLKWMPSHIKNQIYKYLPKLFIGNLGLELHYLLPVLQCIYDDKITFPKLLNIGNRITLLERVFNTRMGLNWESDLFQKFIKNRPDFYRNYEILLNEYYQNKGLTKRGLVTTKALEKSELIRLVSI